MKSEEQIAQAMYEAYFGGATGEDALTPNWEALDVESQRRRMRAEATAKALLRTSTDNDYPAWVCLSCGNKYGNRPYGVATWHLDTCDVCGTTGVEVTEPRDFGYLNLRNSKE